MKYTPSGLFPIEKETEPQAQNAGCLGMSSQPKSTKPFHVQFAEVVNNRIALLARYRNFTGEILCWAETPVQNLTLECFEQACDHEGDICDKFKPAVNLVQVCYLRSVHVCKNACISAYALARMKTVA